MFKAKIIATICILSLCDSRALFNKQSTCSVNDNACQSKVIDEILDELADTGAPEYNIPPLDTFKVNHIKKNIFGIMYVDLADIVVQGFRSCRVTDYVMALESLQAKVNITCDNLKLAGKYMFETLALTNGFRVHGNGTGSIETFKAHASFVFPYEFEKADDGQISMYIKYEEILQHFEVLNKFIIDANNIYIGSVDIAPKIVEIVNENWDLVVNTLSEPFVNRAFEDFCEYLSNIVETVPAKMLFADDMSMYVIE